NKPPRNPDEPIMTKLLWRSTIIYSLSIAIGVVAIVIYSYNFKTYSWAEINNMAFYTLIFSQLLNIFNLPNRKISFFINEVTENGWIWAAIIFSVSIVIGAFSIPLFRGVLDLVPLNFHQLILILLFSLSTLLLSQ
ncbi:cation transporting ATPase C-terminal domain-containing protein, partial [Salinimicrobium oceani]